MRVSEPGKDFIKRREELRLLAYDDLRPHHFLEQGDEVEGILTNGYGHTGPDVFIGQVITEKQADTWFDQDLAKFERGVRDRINGVATSQNQFDAMVSLAYNVGLANFAKSSVLRHHIKGDDEAAARSFLLWNKARVNGVLKPLKGLTERRAAEAEIYLRGH